MRASIWSLLRFPLLDAQRVPALLVNALLLLRGLLVEVANARHVVLW
ncbi:hypothetical protein IV102_13620 [bacterium]|nr:hypothetical protein [bacterium]